MSISIRSFFCGLSGHDLLLHFEPYRLSLRCVSCSFETPGWTLKEPEWRRAPERHQAPRALVEQRAQ